MGRVGRKQVEEQMKGNLSTNVNWGNQWEGLAVNTSGINTVSQNIKDSASSDLTISKTELNKVVNKSKVPVLVVPTIK